MEQCLGDLHGHVRVVFWVTSKKALLWFVFIHSIFPPSISLLIPSWTPCSNSERSSYISSFHSSWLWYKKYNTHQALTLDKDEHACGEMMRLLQGYDHLILGTRHSPESTYSRSALEHSIICINKKKDKKEKEIRRRKFRLLVESELWLWWMGTE